MWVKRPSPALVRLRLHSGALSPLCGAREVSKPRADAHRSNCQTANASPPVFFAAPGTPSFSPRVTRGFRNALRPSPEGMERRAAQPSAYALRRARPAKARRRSALHRGFSVPGTVASGCGRGTRVPPIRPAFASLRPHRVQPFKADPHSRVGRFPRASRERGYEPRPQAPQPPPPSFASHENALGVGRMERNIVVRRN